MLYSHISTIFCLFFMISYFCRVKDNNGFLSQTRKFAFFLRTYVITHLILKRMLQAHETFFQSFFFVSLR